MDLDNCVTVIGASTPAFYHAVVGGAKFDLYIFKAVGAHKFGEAKNIFTAPLDPEEPDPLDFYFADLEINGEAVKRFWLSSGYLGESFDGCFVEADYHGKMQHINLPDDLMHKLDRDGNLDMQTKGFQE